MMRIDNLDIVKRHEGLMLEAYYCPAGVLTIGYGHTRAVSKGMEITEHTATRLLLEDVIDAEHAVNTLVSVNLNQNQFDALVSFVFNLGVGNFKKSTLLKELNDGEYLACANEFRRWVNANGKQLRGLVKRRKEEAHLFIGVVE